LRDVDAESAQKEERAELERRRGLLDEERSVEDKRSGQYQALGEVQRRRLQEKGDSNTNNYNYMDKDTLASAGANDVHHRATRYSRAAMGDLIDRSALPKVMQAGI